MTDATPAISIKNLTKVFRTPTVRKHFVTAVTNLSLEVASGQIYGLIGPNGSGKSTTMKVLLGLLKPTSGSAAIFGRDSSRVDSRNDVGFLLENPYFYASALQKCWPWSISSTPETVALAGTQKACSSASGSPKPSFITRASSFWTNPRPALTQPGREKSETSSSI